MFCQKGVTCSLWTRSRYCKISPQRKQSRLWGLWEINDQRSISGWTSGCRCWPTRGWSETKESLRRFGRRDPCRLEKHISSGLCTPSLPQSVPDIWAGGAAASSFQRTLVIPGVAATRCIRIHKAASRREEASSPVGGTVGAGAQEALLPLPLALLSLVNDSRRDS